MATATNKGKAAALAALPLGQRATALAGLQAEAAEAKAKLKARAEAEAERLKAFAAETKAMDEDRQQILARVKVAHEAMEEIRRTRVPAAVRQEVKDAELAERQAEAKNRAAQSDANHGRAEIRIMKDRAAKIPVGADPKDVLADIRRMEQENAKREADAASAAAELEAAKKRAEVARAAHEAALQAALAE